MHCPEQTGFRDQPICRFACHVTISTNGIAETCTRHMGTRIAQGVLTWRAPAYGGNRVFRHPACAHRTEQKSFVVGPKRPSRGGRTNRNGCASTAVHAKGVHGPHSDRRDCTLPNAAVPYQMRQFDCVP